MTDEEKLRETMDNAICAYIKELGGIDAEDVDFNPFDEWIDGVTGVENPLTRRDDEVDYPSPAEVYPEDVSNWVSEQNEINREN